LAGEGSALRIDTTHVTPFADARVVSDAVRFAEAHAGQPLVVEEPPFPARFRSKTV
jgi:hypothetical protein